MPSSFHYNGKVIRGILFDLDGTLYNQKMMQAYMLLDLLLYYSAHLNQISDLRIIYYFRKMRYSVSHKKNIEQEQYNIVAEYLHVPQEKVRELVAYWIEQRPLRYIKKCKYDFIDELFMKARSSGIRIAIVSDYPVEKKLKALGLTCDIAISSTDSNVDSLKPDPKGFLVAAEKLNLNKEDCLVIGDRDEKDGEGARRAGMPFIKINKSLLNLFI